jgi:hypothetical protein
MILQNSSVETKTITLDTLMSSRMDGIGKCGYGTHMCGCTSLSDDGHKAMSIMRFEIDLFQGITLGIVVHQP